MFDPYYKWLAILPKDQPPTHYRLLGLEPFESDLDVIEGAADRAMTFVRQYQAGEHAALAAKLLNEVAAARLCLLKATSKAEYDAKLRLKLAKSQKALEDESTFAIDDELSELVSAKKTSGRSRRKKSKPARGYWIATGISVVAGFLIVAMFVTRGGHRPPNHETTQGTEGTKRTDGNKVADQPVSNLDSATKPVEKPASANAGSTIPLVESKLIAEPAGPAIDLFRSIEKNRDLISGSWTREGTSLVGTPNSKIYLPETVPADYQLRFNVTRESGKESFVVGFPMEGRTGTIAFDSYGGGYSGLYIDGRTPNANCTTRQGMVFRNSEASTVVITVHPGHLHATVNDVTIVNWYGQSNRLVAFADEGMTNRETPFLVTYGSNYRIDSAAMIPIKPEPAAARIAKLDKEIELIPILDTDRDAEKGVWAISKNILHSPEAFGQFGRFSLPAVVPDEYTLSMNVEIDPSARGRQVLVVGLPTKESCCTIPMVNDDCIGIEKIDGNRWNANETRQGGPYLFPGRSATLACTVTRRGIRMEVDGRTVIDWTGDLKRLSLQEDWAPIDARKIFLGTETHFKFRDIKLGPPIDAPRRTESALPADGRAIDLLAIVDPRRDSFAGTWTKDDAGLHLLADVQNSKLAMPCQIPDEYKLNIRVARETGGKAEDALVLMLPTESSIAEIVLDSGGNCGLYYDRLPCADARNRSTRQVKAIPPGPAVELAVFVRKTGIKVTSGTTTLFDWNGNPNRLSVESGWTVPGNCIGMGSWNSRFRIEKLELQPLEPSSFPAVPKLGADGNLLAIIDPERDSRAGEWPRESNVLICPIYPINRLRIPAELPMQYAFTVKLERRKGDTDLFLGLVVNGHPCIAALDGAKGSQSGFMAVDDKLFYDDANPTRREYAKPVLLPGKPVTIQCYVLPDSVVVRIGDRDVLRWRGDARRFSSPLGYQPPNYSDEDRNHLWIGGYDSEFAIHELNLMPLDDDQAEQISKGFSGVYPTEISRAVEAEPGLPFDEVASDTLVDGNVFLLINTNSGRCLSVSDGKMIQGPFAHRAGAGERWKLVSAGDDIRWINEKTGNTVAVIGDAAEAGKQLIEKKPANEMHQRWEAVPVGNHYSFRSRLSGLVLAVGGSRKNEGAGVIHWKWENIADQVWQVKKLKR